MTYICLREGRHEPDAALRSVSRTVLDDCFAGWKTRVAAIETNEVSLVRFKIRTQWGCRREMLLRTAVTILALAATTAPPAAEPATDRPPAGQREIDPQAQPAPDCAFDQRVTWQPRPSTLVSARRRACSCRGRHAQPAHTSAGARLPRTDTPTTARNHPISPSARSRQPVIT
jgi:hypothetical protein